MKLRSKFFVSFLGIALLSIFITSTTAYLTMQTELENEIYSNFYYSNQIRTEHIENHVNTLIHTTEHIADEIASSFEVPKNIIPSQLESLEVEANAFKITPNTNLKTTTLDIQEEQIQVSAPIGNTNQSLTLFFEDPVTTEDQCKHLANPYCAIERWNSLETKIEATEACPKDSLITLGFNENNERVLRQQTCIARTFTYTSEIKEKTALEGLHALKNRLLIATSLISLLVMILLHYPYSRVITPVEELTKNLKKIRRRKKPVPLINTQNDEISELIEAFNEMQNHMLMFKLAVDDAFDQIVISDPQGKIIYANSATKEVTGFSPKESMGKTPSLWGGHMDRKFYDKMWETIRDKKSTFYGEFENVHKSGRKYTSQAYITPLLNNKGDIEYYLSIQRDITKQKKIDKARTEFTSLASHQLNTPLAGVHWASSELLSKTKKKLNKEEYKNLMKIEELTDHMKSVMKLLVNIAKVEIGERKVKKESIKLPAFTKNLVKEMNEYITKYKGNVKVYGAKNITKEITTDPDMLKEALSNLITNAIKYSPNKSLTRIDLGTKGKRVFISVTDKGQGIPKDEQAFLFDRFARGENAKYKNVPGTGLGLYFTNKIVTLLKGKITVKSEVDKGSTFTIWLPY